MNWLSVDRNWAEGVQVRSLAALKNIPITQAMGLCLKLGLWLIDQEKRRTFEGLSDAVIADIAGWTGDVSGFSGALVASGVLDQDMRLWDWAEFTKVERARARNAQRIQEWRERHRQKELDDYHRIKAGG